MSTITSFSNSLATMNHLARVLGSVFSILLLTYCQSTDIPQKNQRVSTAKLYHEGLIACFEQGLKNAKGKDLYCETSAIIHIDNKLILANDKSMPDGLGSSIFSLPFTEGMPQEVKPENYSAPPFLNARKVEGLTLTPDHQYILATTAFDRIKKDSSKWDGYNTILIWPVGSPESVKVVSPSSRDGVVSSLKLREKLSSALKSKQFPDGPPYFKVEGLAAIPGGKLLFGIREVGRKYDDFDYVVKVVSVSYTILNDEMKLEDNFELVYEYDPSTVWLKHTIGLSSLEYDKYHDRLYMLTSFETDSEIGGFLWELPMTKFYGRERPRLVKDQRGKPVKFTHKAEGISVIDNNRVIVINDDDRVTNGRKPYQAVYYLLEFTDRS